MRFLDENIIATVQTAQYATGRATFRVQWRANSGADASDIYHGILFAAEDENVQVDVTEILASYRHDWDILTKSYTGAVSNISDWVGQYRVIATFGSDTYTGEWEDVALVYRNPETLASFAGTSEIRLLQPGLTPHVPYNTTPANYMSSLFLEITTPGIAVRLREFSREWATPGIYIVDGYAQGTCASRYYLRWIDRWGSMQQQPFDGKIVHTEDVVRTNITNSQGSRRMVQAETTPKWQLNTQWLDEDTMPLWEGIFVSPYAALYDTVLGIVYPVLITDKTYTKKTYKNNKLFNLTINVEAAKKQSVRN